ncbi:MAG: Crp/Fnr family transcriptional regulator [Deltaproteobacteria bacterium]|jgi:CRP-like cAMP-binding protein|nr:Crp/Fnr family transcriptional regulator [Deltaproteobacteria bacterium]
MDIHTSALSHCGLFAGTTDEERKKLLGCLAARVKQFEKDAPVFLENEAISAVGIVLSGAVHVVRDDFWGNRTIISRMGTGELFAESFSFAGTPHIPVGVVATEKTEALFIDCRKIMGFCTQACSFHKQIIGNIFRELAEKNIRLMEKIDHITRRGTREKLLSYLSGEARQAGRGEFAIPFTRKELAEYLAVDRSAMSAELGRMRDEGLLVFRKNRFTLFDKTPLLR